MIAQGTMNAPAASLFLDGDALSGFPVRAAIHRVEQFAGATPGSAVVSYPANLADNPTAQMGTQGKVKVGNNTIFRGVVLSGPVKVDDSDDALQLVMMDDKFLMGFKKLGQYGVGSVGTPPGSEGFPDVGFECVFNAKGAPNKSPSAYTFSLGSNAVLWTLRDVMRFIFQWYVPATVATIEAGQIAHTAYAAIPCDLNLTNQSALQAVDQVAQLAGESWGLIPGANASSFVSVRSGAGTVRAARMFKPFGGAKATSASEEHASECGVGVSIENAVDVAQVFSAAVVRETTVGSTGDTPLFARVTGFKDKEYAARWQIDVTKYSAHRLGNNLTAGARTKKIAKDLVTRLKTDASGYITAAEIVADPTLQERGEKLQPFVWVATDGTAANAKLVESGYRLNTDHGTIDFKTRLTLAKAVADAGDETLDIEDWSTFGFWVTLATELELPEVAQTTDATSYLPTHNYLRVDKGDLVPERRHLAWLPDLASANQHAVAKAAPDAEEKYIDVTAKLAEHAANILKLSPEIETPVDVMLPFFPIWNIGDLLQVSGRNLGATKELNIISISYDIYESYEVRVAASNVASAIDPEKFIRKRK